MPKISAFFGMIVTMYSDEPQYKIPHFHVRYAGRNAAFSVEDPRLLVGRLPTAETRRILAWAKLHENELLENYRRLQNGESSLPIKPLKK